MRRIIVVAVGALLLATGPAAGVSSQAPSGTVASVTDEDLEGPGWVLAVGDVEVVPVARAGYATVLVEVVVRNVGGEPLSLGDLADGRLPGDAVLLFEDRRGIRHPVDLLRPLTGALPGSNLTAIEPGLAARWTFGFEVPAGAVDGRVVVAAGDEVLAAWDGGAAEREVTIDLPERTIRLGDEIPWARLDGGTIRVRPEAVGSLLCGDPALEPPTVIVAVAMRVTNDAPTDYVWPGARFPDVPATAQWADGASARTFLETSVDGPDPYHRYLGGAGILLPADTETRRAFLMAAPRDGRFVDPTRLPAGVLFTPPDGVPVWLDLSGVRPTIGIDPGTCDLGGAGGPLPYAVAPAPAYPTPPTIDAETAARSLIRSALAAAVIRYDRTGRTLEGTTTAELEGIAPTLRWIAHDPEDPPATATGTVYYAVLDARTFYAITEAVDGRWFCTKLPIGDPPVRGDAATATDAAALCLEKAIVDDDGS